LNNMFQYRQIIIYFFIVTALPCFAQKPTSADVARYNAQAKKVTIVRDNWGVPHIYAKTDADVVFGLLYAQCEENFKGVERNYLNQLGRTAEADGSSGIYNDLLMRLAEDSTAAINDYKSCPIYFKKLLNAFADGVNYYLYKHPEVKPAVLKHFEPWYALMFTDGSVAATLTGGATVDEVEHFYSNGNPKYSYVKPAYEPIKESGSNGFAISPGRSVSGNAMLYINPHVPHYFRSEVAVESEEGLHAYGAVTWGQFFIYQGFNPHCGWMHTSSYADAADLYAEKVIKNDKGLFYEYNGSLKPVTTQNLTIACKGQKPLKVTTYYTHHGPVMAARNGKWLTLKAINRSLPALIESWQITKANNLAEYRKGMSLLSNATNNTVYADDKGNTAFWYGNLMPKRDPKYDWTLPVDGTTSATEWQGFHGIDEIVHVYNPATGFIQNCNSTPFTCSGPSSPEKKSYPDYMAPDGENFRGVNALRLLNNEQKMDLNGMIAKGYDTYLAAFDVMLPPLFKAYDNSSDSVRKKLNSPMQLLKQWDKYVKANSVASTLALQWGTLMMAEQMPKAKTSEASTYAVDRVNTMMLNTAPSVQIKYLLNIIADLEVKFGTWQVQWGDLNRYQRVADGQPFDDAKPSLPVGLASSAFGALPSVQSRTFNTKKRYTYSGNSFMAAVEFGKRIKAKSLITGGQYFDPNSEHFTDQAQMYIDGTFKDVLFYKDDVLKHAAQTYHPGQ
jgi:acyl-homoserine-lactone acylase